ncbi:hypothetical protein LYSIN_01537 [Lysinibacillus sphaericus]|uniref:Uncharacterized protein n=1 Tax=Lysinibacillus sphaericus TaxID=1421 RepID=A0A2S5D119_LYSSH|nr:hypothetical protein LYSIN_01537 [Lysinibacillus sphaericus]
MTSTSITSISGFKIEGDTRCTVYAPIKEPKKIKGKIFPILLKSTLPARKNVSMLVPLLMVFASLFVAMAVLGGNPTAINAGKEIKPPPPTMAFKKDAIKPNTNNVPSESK